MKALHISFQTAFERKGVIGLHAAFAGFRVVAHGGGHGALVVKAVLQAQIAIAHIIGNIGVVVIVAVAVKHRRPHFGNHRKLAPFHARHGVNAVPRARQRPPLPVGLVHNARAQHPQLAAAGQIGFHRLGDKHFGHVIVIAKRRRFLTLAPQLPMRGLRVAKPHIGTGFKQIFHQFGFKRHLHFGFEPLLLGRHRIVCHSARGRFGIAVGAAVVPGRQQIHGIVLAHRQNAARIVLVEVIHLAQRRVGLGRFHQRLRRLGVCHRGTLVKHNLGFAFIQALVNGAHQIHRFCSGHSRCGRRSGRELRGIHFIETRQAHGIILHQRALQRRIIAGGSRSRRPSRSQTGSGKHPSGFHHHVSPFINKQAV